MKHERLTGEILGACFEVAAELGSGFLELVYQNALMVALLDRRLRVACRKAVAVRFRGHVVTARRLAWREDQIVPWGIRVK